jgi:hypothetical protein
MYPRSGEIGEAGPRNTTQQSSRGKTAHVQRRERFLYRGAVAARHAYATTARKLKSRTQRVEQDVLPGEGTVGSRIQRWKPDQRNEESRFSKFPRSRSEILLRTLSRKGHSVSWPPNLITIYRCLLSEWHKTGLQKEEKLSPYPIKSNQTVACGLLGSEMSRIPHRLDNGHTHGGNVRTGRTLLHRNIIFLFLVLISDRGWVNPRAKCGRKD